MPNHRQLAILLWSAGIFIVALTRRDVRDSIRNVLGAMLVPSILVVMAGFLLNITLILLAARAVGAWNWRLATDTAAWIVTSGAVLFGNYNEASCNPRFFSTKARQVVGLTVVVGILLEISIMPLVVELVLIPILSIVTAVTFVARRKEGSAQVAAVMNGCLTIVGLLLLGVAGYRGIVEWSNLDKLQLGRQALLPIWLTVTVLPYIYLLSVYASYDSIFRRLNWKSKQNWWRRTVVKAVVIWEYGVQARSLAQIDGNTVFALADCATAAEARRVIALHRKRLAAKATEVEARAERLVQYAGVDGNDENGQRLDRREFKETTEALRWLATCHTGWWRREERYVSGLLDLISSTSNSQGLTPDAGIHEYVTEDGTAWYAWRRTISGWVFAIGARSGPPDQWTFDGPGPPNSPPGVDPVWGTHPFGSDVSPNW